jgi:hypothetical protein
MPYSEKDIDAAVAAGAISADSAHALRDFVVTHSEATPANEENFRLLSGFNDIFVAIAAIIMLVAIWWIGNSLQANLHDYSGPKRDEYLDHYGRYKAVGAFFCAGTAWLLAEFFARKRKLALPSIVLLLAMVIGLFTGVYYYFLDVGYTEYGRFHYYVDAPAEKAGMAAQMIREHSYQAAAAICAAIASYFFWRRFRVPIAIAATTGMAALSVLFGFSCLARIEEISGVVPLLIIFVLGVVTFSFAMRWDFRDRERKTQQSDIAFWLHMVAAPMIAHGLFGLIGVSNGGDISVVAVVVALLLYALFAVVAIAVDRRALLVSALIYVLVALTALFRTFGVIELSAALTALVIGSALLLLSAFWDPIRKRVLAMLPSTLADRMPA